MKDRFKRLSSVVLVVVLVVVTTDSCKTSVTWLIVGGAPTDTVVSSWVMMGEEGSLADLTMVTVSCSRISVEAVSCGLVS